MPKSGGFGRKSVTALFLGLQQFLKNEIMRKMMRNLMVFLPIALSQTVRKLFKKYEKILDSKKRLINDFAN